MAPRPYNMEKRQHTASETRARILEAARQLLASELETDLSMDAIAGRADVSRLTIYYQFKSRTGVLEALYDYLAMRGNMQRMAEVFHETDGLIALNKLIRTFVGFWSSDPVVIRRLRAMAALDSEIGKGIQERDRRRVQASSEILRRINLREKKKPVITRNLAADVLTMLTSFETYDALARAGHSKNQIVAAITSLARFAGGHR
jgi:AcrR family transcriptional regulator